MTKKEFEWEKLKTQLYIIGTCVLSAGVVYLLFTKPIKSIIPFSIEDYLLPPIFTLTGLIIFANGMFYKNVKTRYEKSKKQESSRSKNKTTSEKSYKSYRPPIPPK